MAAFRPAQQCRLDVALMPGKRNKKRSHYEPFTKGTEPLGELQKYSGSRQPRKKKKKRKKAG